MSVEYSKRKKSTIKNSLSSPDDIAIIGMACRFPGAKNYNEYWDNLSKGINSISEITKDRWDIDTYYSADPDKPNTSVSKWGGLISGIDEFDAPFFHISPREAMVMDPQQRLLLEETWHCIEDAGISALELQQQKTSVYVGVMAIDYQYHMFESGHSMDNYECLGNYEGILSNRLSYFFNLTGDSQTTDSACASSLVSIDSARRSLIAGACDYAFAAGVSVICHHWRYISFSKSHMLSPSGQCKTFDAQADGYVPGEGVGVLLLCPLSKAIEKGYHIYGVIKGLAVKHSGKSKSITAPRIEIERQVIEEAMACGSISPESITYVETHGTGTSLGDPIEVEALTQAFHTKKLQYCDVGSVKSNIGHLEAAAGVAGVIKVLMMMKHRQIPKTLNVETVNPIIDFEHSPFRIADTLHEWELPSGGDKRRAGVSSFGFGGVNAHVILEEYLTNVSYLPSKQTVMPFLLSTKTMRSLQNLLTSWRNYVDTGDFKNACIQDICSTLMHGREALAYRFGMLIDMEHENVIRAIIENEASDVPIKKRSTILRVNALEHVDFSSFEQVCQHFSFLSVFKQECIDAIRGLKKGTTILKDLKKNKSTTLRLQEFIIHYSIGKALLANGVTPEYITGEGVGGYVGAVLSGLLDLTDGLSWLVQEKKDIHLKRPQISFYAIPQDCLIEAYHVNLSYCQQLVEEATFDSSVLQSLVATSKVLLANQPTFKQYLHEWDDVLAEYDLDLEHVFDHPEVLKKEEHRLFTVIVLLESHKRLNDKWHLAGKISMPSPGVAEIIDLILDGVLTHHDAAYFLLNDKKLDKITAHIQKHLYLIDANKPYPLLKQFSRELPEVTHVDEWLKKIIEHKASKSEQDKPMPTPRHPPLYVDLGRKHFKADSTSVVLESTDWQHELPTFLIHLWNQGVAINWGHWYDAQGFYRVALPNYPFEKEHFWVDHNHVNKSDVSVQQKESINPIANLKINLETLRKKIALDLPMAEQKPSVQVQSNTSVSDPTNKILAILSKVLFLESDKIETNKSFVDIGFDSILGVEFINQTNKEFKLNLAATKIYDYPTVDSFSQYLRDQMKFTGGEKTSTVLKAVRSSQDNDELIQKILIILAGVLFCEPDKIETNKSFVDIGFDSILGVEFINRINKEFQLNIAATKIYDYPTIEIFSHYLGDQFMMVSHDQDNTPTQTTMVLNELNDAPKEEHVAQVMNSEVIKIQLSEVGTFEETSNNRTQVSPQDIAIIGMAAKMPGAKNLAEYWDNLQSGRSSITDIPQNRWSIAQFYDPDLRKPQKSYCKRGGFLDDIDQFDPLFFNISPSDAEWMDPQQRLFLQTAWLALEDAGYTSQSLSNTQCGIYAGIMNNDYLDLIERSNSDRNAPQLIGNANSMLPARIAYLLNLKGPAVALDTACSSSLVAVHLACKTLQNGEADLMLAGGVTLYLTESPYIEMCKAGMLSPEGECKTFDNQADGFVPGEGVGVVLLKRLDQAIADHDHIYGVIKGSGINQDGKTNGITAPSAPSQKELELGIYKKYQIDPATISYVEAHGTGTKLGDPIEMEALTEAFRTFTDKTQYCAIGSVKTNIGHTSAAAGVASLIKVLLCLQHKILVPSLNYQESNEHIHFQDSPFYVITEEKHWETSPGVPRRAAISAFGFSGTNAHLVLEEAKDEPVQSSVDNNSYYLLTLSAKNQDVLQERIADLQMWLTEQVKDQLAPSLTDISYTLNVQREHFEKRCALVVGSIDELLETMSQINAGLSPVNYIVNLEHVRRAPVFDELLVKITEEVSYNQTLTSSDYQKKLLSLAELYCRGYSLDWAKLYPSKKRPKIVLPHYPFAKEHYWLPEQKFKAEIKKTSICYYSETWALQKLIEDKNTSAFNASTLIIDDEKEFSQKLRNKYPNADIAQIATNQFHDSLKNLYNPSASLPELIIYRTYLSSEESLPHDQINSMLQQSFYHLFNLIQFLVLQKPSRAINIICVNVNNSEEPSIFTQALSGLAKTAHIEQPMINCRIIQIPKSQDQDILWLKKEINTHVAEVKYDKNGDRYIRQFNQVAASKEVHQPLLKREGVYLITGGMGGLGLIFARYLAEMYHARLILVGRSRLNQKQTQTIHSLVKLGAKVLYVQADVTNHKDVEHLIDKIKHEFNEINGIIHSAGIINDAYILKKQPEEMADVLAPKILGALYLDEVTRSEPLDFIVLFSSIAAVFGNVGQCDYAYANSFLDYFSAYRNGLSEKGLRHGKTLSINWPLWESEDGMQIDEAAKEWLLRTFGMLPLQIQDGLNAFSEALMQEGSQFLVLPGQQVQFEASLQQMSKVPQEAQVADVIETAVMDKVDVLRTTEEYLRTLLSEPLRYPAEKIDINIPFEEYGIDSIMITKLNQTLEQIADDLPKTLFFEYQTIKELAQYLLAQHSEAIVQKIIGKRAAVTEEKSTRSTAIKESVLSHQHPLLDQSIVNTERSRFTKLITGNEFYLSDHRIQGVPTFPGVAYLEMARAAGAINKPDQKVMALRNIQWSKPIQIVDDATVISLSLVNKDHAHVTFEINTQKGTECSLHSSGQIVYGNNDDSSLTLDLASIKDRCKLMASGAEIYAHMGSIGLDYGLSFQVIQREWHNDREVLAELQLPEQSNAEFTQYALHPSMMDAALQIIVTLIENCHSQLYLPFSIGELQILGKIPKHCYAYGTIIVGSVEKNIPTFNIQIADDAGNVVLNIKNFTVMPYQKPAPAIAKDTIQKPQRTEERIEDIAIIGMSGVFPGSPELSTFWDNLIQDKDLITEIPHSRWDWQSIYGDGEHQTNVKWGGFINDIDKFDANFFNISAREAALMDPQQRIFLEVVWKAMEDAGYTQAMLSKFKTGLFVGVGTSDYAEILQQQNENSAHVPTGVQHSVLANRVSYVLNLHGPSEPINTACSSSLIAIHNAVRAIQAGDCEVAIVGGVNALLTPSLFIKFDHAGMLSPDGHCKTFDKSANGYARGEGAGVIILKPLSKAQKDHDVIHAVIKGTATNHGGHVSSLTVPNPNAQAEVIATAIERAAIDVETISYIEAHGTGTPLGDPIEVAGLNKAFKSMQEKQGKPRLAARSCGLGTVKTNIGHLETAAGIAGVIKVLLAMKQKQIPGTLHFKEVNPAIDFKDGPFYVIDKTQAWKRFHDQNGKEIPLRAGISSFGFGGTNAHVILEEAPMSEMPDSRFIKPSYLFTLSAKTEDSLKQKLDDLAEWLNHHNDESLEAISYTLNAGRVHYDKRCIIVASSVAELQETLDKCKKGQRPDNYLVGITKTEHEPIFDELCEKILGEIVNYETLELKTYRKKLLALGDLYIKGYELDGELLHRNESRHKISMPTYPFAKERYWHTSNQQADTLREVKTLEIKIEEPSVAPLLQLKDIRDKQPVSTKTAEQTTAGLSADDKNIISHQIKCILAKSLFVDPESIPDDKKFIELGLDSILGVELIKNINTAFSLNLNATLLFDYSTLALLSERICSQLSKDSPVVTSTSPVELTQPQLLEEQTSVVLSQLETVDPVSAPTIQAAEMTQKPVSTADVAIIGMAGQFPGAKNLAEYWNNLQSGKSSITDIPQERWSIAQFYDPDSRKPCKSYCKRGGFLDEADRFDPLFFKISPRDAEWMDPQQRLLLLTAWAALEDAGYTPQMLSDTRCGIYAGIMNNDYLELIDRGYRSDRTAQHMIGNSNSILPARISYFLNLKGPAVALDTACSSSLVATHLACQALQSGEAELMLAGGVTLYLTESPYISMSKAGMLSPEGECKTFDNHADGFVPGEGVGLILLKRLDKALADGDHIYGVIKGSGINQDGATNGITAPSAKSQTELELGIYKKYQIDPATISYVEAHGTATKLGDPIEVRALTEAFRTFTDKKQYCAIGSVKTNVGHTSAAAGVASIIKVLLCLHHKKLVPSLNYQEANEHIHFEDSPFYVITEQKDWERIADEPRRAAVSAFGFSGTNAHLVIEEAQAESMQASADNSAYYMLTLSAKNQTALQQRAMDLQAWLSTQVKDKQALSLADISYTLNVRRAHFEKRCALVTHSIEELLTLLEGVQTSQTSSMLFMTAESKEKNHDQSTLKEPLKQTMAELEHARDRTSSDYRDHLMALANFYVNACDLDWGQLYQNDSRKVIPLPTYPFADEHYWLPQVSLPVASVQEMPVSTLHPLLDANTSIRGIPSFVKTFTGNAFYLTDHRLMGVPVLPGVAYLEMARACSALSFPERSVASLNNVIWSVPLRCKDQPQLTTISISPESSGMMFEVTTDNGQVKHAQGKINFASQDKVVTAEALDLSAIKQRCVTHQSHETIYAQLQESNLAYGPSFQVIDTLSFNENESLARLVLPTHLMTTANQFSLHPSLLDGSLQTVMGLLNQSHEQQTFVPFGLGEIVLYGDLPPICYAYATRATGESSALRFNIHVVDDTGRVLVHIKDFSVRAMPINVEEKPAVHYYEPIWEQQALSASTVSGPILVLDASDHLIKLLEVNYPQAEIYQLTRHDRVDYERLLDEMIGRQQMPKHILYRANWGGTIETQIKDGFLPLVSLAQALIQRHPKEEIRILCVQEQDSPMSAALSGLAKTISLEQPKLVCRVVAAEDLADAIKELGGTDVEVKYERDHNRLVKRYQAYNKSDKTNLEQVFKADGVYWITGGAGGLGLIFARYIAKRYQAKVILTGRSELKAEQQAILTDLNQGGAEVIYSRLDVTQQKDVERVAQEIKNRFGKLTGVIHSAGVLRDAFIPKKTPDELLSVLAPKIQGTIYLDEVTRGEPLDFFVMFSSIAAVLGNVGQCDYAYANAFMDAYARYRDELSKAQKRHGKTVAINWPFWAEGGMQLEEATLAWMEQTWGASPLATSDGIQAYIDALVEHKVQQVVLVGNQHQLAKRLGAVQVAAFASEAPLASLSEEGLVEKVQAQLTAMLSELLKIDVKIIDAQEHLSEYGVDSITMTMLAGEMNQFYGLELTPAVLFEYMTLASLAQYLVQDHEAVMKARNEEAKVVSSFPIEQSAPLPPRQQEPSVAKLTKDTDIAIIGMSGVFPGSPDLDRFWDNLLAQKDLITEIPKERWDWNAYYGEGKNKTKVKWGGFIQDIDQFDAEFFNISPREAEVIDPQQRIFLQVVWKAIEDAGYKPSDLTSTKTGLFVGVSTNDYAGILQAAEENSGPSSTGLAHSVLANRISYLFDLHGPSEAIDTACSSSLVAINHAIKAIVDGDCEMAIAGGVNALLTPQLYLAFSSAGMLCEDGRCKTFDKSANGYVRGEGAGAILLKPLAKALADGDTLYGVIKGAAVNHSGRVSSLTVPNPNAQAEVIVSAMERANADVAAISYVEAHGTGTSLGDPIEVNGLKKAFRALAEKQGKTDSLSHYCGLGTVKTNIGHLEAAAGIAGVIKVLLAMKYQQLPGILHFKELNPYVEIKDSPFYILDKNQVWNRLKDKDGKEIQRLAGISSFGFGGTNAHVIIEEAPRNEMPGSRAIKPDYLFTLSAKTEDSLKQKIDDLAEWLNHHNDESLEAISYTLNVGRVHYDKRCIIVASSVAELQETLDKCKKEQHPDNYLVGITKTEREPIFDELLEKILGVIANYESLDPKAYRKNLLALGDLYTKGYEIDWDILHRNESRHKISMPTYPFAKKRYWVGGYASRKPECHEHVAPIHLTSTMAENHEDASNIQMDSLIQLKEINSVTPLEINVENNEISSQGVADILQDIPSSFDKQSIEKEIKRMLATALYIDENSIDMGKNFSELGLDSILGVELIKHINTTFALNLNATTLFDYPTVPLFSEHICSQLSKESNVVASTSQVELDQPQSIKAATEITDDIILDNYKKLFLNYDKLNISLYKTSHNFSIEIIQAGVGEPLLLLPPGACNATAWRYQIDYFSRYFHVISINDSGCGRSEFNELALNLDFKADLIMEVMHSLNLNSRFHLVGWSFGGVVAEYVAGKFPHRIQTLTLVSTSPAYISNGVDDSLKYSKILEENFINCREQCNPAIEITQEQISGVNSAEYKKAWLSPVNFDANEMLPRIQAPTLIIAGELDPVILLEEATQLNEKIKNSMVHIIKSGGHYLPLFNHDHFNKVLEQFIMEHRIQDKWH